MDLFSSSHACFHSILSDVLNVGEPNGNDADDTHDLPFNGNDADDDMHDLTFNDNDADDMHADMLNEIYDKTVEVSSTSLAGSRLSLCAHVSHSRFIWKCYL